MTDRRQIVGDLDEEGDHVRTAQSAPLARTEQPRPPKPGIFEWLTAPQN